MAEVAASLDALTAKDFDNTNVESTGLEQLNWLCDEIRELDDAATCAPVMFRTMERLSEVELGTPGPLVHTLESWPGRYESLLAESIRRRPTYLTVWMVNRILNTRPSDADAWLALLRETVLHPDASESVKADAARFIQYQVNLGPDS